MPFITIPILWSYFSKIYYLGNNKTRIHNENLELTEETSDSYEEIIWKIYFKDYIKLSNEVIRKNHEDKFFQKKYCNFIDKICFLNKSNLYLTKNNSNILRIEYLKKIFPQFKMIYCIREPLQVVCSSLRIDNIFNNLDKNEIDQLSMIGHNEFGPKKKFFNVHDFEKSKFYLQKNMIADAYLQQWININMFIIKNEIHKDKNFFLVNYESFVKNEGDYLLSIANFLNTKKKLMPFQNLKKKKINKISQDLINDKNNLKIANEIYQKMISKNE